jgi:hypothetical protein
VVVAAAVVTPEVIERVGINVGMEVGLACVQPIKKILMSNKNKIVLLPIALPLEQKRGRKVKNLFFIRYNPLSRKVP